EGTAIVNLRNLHAQSADVDRRFAEQFFASEFVDHPERFLRFTEGKHRHENAAAGAKRAIDCLRQATLFSGTSESFRRRTIATRRLDNEHINTGLGKNRA